MDHVSTIFSNKNKFFSPPPMDENTKNSDDFLIPENTSLPIPPTFHETAKPIEPNDPHFIPQTAPVTAPVMPNILHDNNEDLKTYMYKIKDQVDAVLRILEGREILSTPLSPTTEIAPVSEKNEKVIEGTFNGEKMIGDNAEIFDVSQNYASKSKLVDGDRMKLTITDRGTFVYKQIKPIERKRIRGELVCGNMSGQWLVICEGKNYKVLTAAVTFHRGRIGDEVVLLLPHHGHSDWGTIEHIIHKDLL